MSTNYPTSQDNFTNPTDSDTLADVNHAAQHSDANDAIEALEAKLGTGDSTAADGQALIGTGAGTSGWRAIAESDISDLDHYDSADFNTDLATKTLDDIGAGTTNKHFTATDESKLDGIEAGATANPNALDNIVEDTTPQLGGNLDTNGNNIQVNGANGILTISSDTDGGDFNIGSNASGTLAIYGTAGNTLDVDLLDGSLSLSGGGTVDGRDVSADGTKLDGVEAGADVTDATNVAAAGAVMEADTTTADMDFVLDEDDMSSNSATKLATQQSIKAYSDTPWVDIDRLGFVDRTESTLSFDDSTYTLTLTDAGAGWSYYRNGLKYTISGNKTSTISGSPPTAGIYYFYIDANDGTITNSTSEWTLQDDKVPICTVYWDNTATPKYWISDERHSVALDKAMHYYIHTVEGAKIVTVPTLSGYTIDTDTDAAKAFGISAGALLDQDILHTLGALSDPDGLSADYVIWYRTSSTTWSWKYSIMPFDYTAAGYINYDNAGTQTQGQASKWYNTYLLATNATGDARYVFISGRSEFSSLANAQAEDVASFDWTGLEITEGVILYRFTWNTSNAYSSTGKCRLDVAPVALEIATSGVTAGGGIDHNSLANLQGGTTAEFYHLTSAELSSVGTALQPSDIASGTITARTGDVNLSGGSDGDVLTVQADGSLAVETPSVGSTSPLTTKGDVYTYSTADARLGVGTDGQVLTADSAETTGLKWATPSAGGGQSPYNAVVASSGGDYTTLGAALAAASNGWTIFVKDGTTETGSVTSTLTDITIVGSDSGNRVNISSYIFTFSGTNVTIKGLGFSVTTGSIALSGNYPKVLNNDILATDFTTGTATLFVSGHYGLVDGNTIVNTQTTGTFKSHFRTSMDNGRVTNNYISGAINGASNGVSHSYFGGSEVIVGNQFISSSVSSVYFVTLGGSSQVFDSNKLLNASGSIYAIYCASGTGTSISNNHISTVFLRGIFIDATHVRVHNNYLYTNVASSYGIYVGGSRCTINSNWVANNSGTSDISIFVASSVDDTVIDGNYIYYSSQAIKINASTCDRTIVTSNNMYGSTADLSDAGTGTVAANNVT